MSPEGGAPLDDADQLAALRSGDEQVFAALVARHHTSMVRVARSYVATREAAEDVVQETWLGVVNGLDRFEGRASLKTWIFRILVNQAKSRGARDARSRPFSAFEVDDGGPTVDPTRFVQHGRSAGHWSVPPSPHTLPEEHVVLAETGALLLAAIEGLPPAQRAVITLRDVQGFGSAEVCELLEISEGNQRVLLHRARSKARAALEQVLDGSAAIP